MQPVSTIQPASASKLSARSRKWLQLFLQQLAAKGQEPVAQAIGVHESTITRLKEHLPNLCAVLDQLELKIVPQSMKCYDPKDIESIFHQARRYTELIKSADDLQFQDDE